jgi:hypothetical protein
MAKEATFKELAKDVLDMVIGESPIPNEEESAKINADIAEKGKDVGLDEILPFAKKILNLNVLDKKVDFKIFESFPALWQKLYGTSIDLVAVENRQTVLAK